MASHKGHHHKHHHKFEKIVPEKFKHLTQEKLQQLTRREVIKYVIACLLFGTLPILSKGNSLGPLQFTFLRVMSGTFFLMTIFCCSTFRATLWDYTRIQLIYLAISGTCIGFSWIIMADSAGKLGFTTSTLTYSLGPAFLLIAAPFLFKDVHLTIAKIIGFVVCTLGVLLMDYELFVTSTELNVVKNVLIAAIFTVVIVYCNRKLENISGLENAMFQMIVAFIIISVVYITRHGFYFEVPVEDSWRIVIAGIVNTGLPVWLYLSSIDDLRPDIIAFVGYLRPITTLIVAALVLNEPFTWETGLGSLFVLGGVAIVNFFGRKKLRKNRTF